MDCNISHSLEIAYDSTGKLKLQTSSKHKEKTISDKRIHQKHNYRLQLGLQKDYNVDPFKDCLSTDQEIDFFRGSRSNPSFTAS